MRRRTFLKRAIAAVVAATGAPFLPALEAETLGHEFDGFYEMCKYCRATRQMVENSDVDLTCPCQRRELVR